MTTFPFPPTSLPQPLAFSSSPHTSAHKLLISFSIFELPSAFVVKDSLRAAYPSLLVIYRLPETCESRVGSPFLQVLLLAEFFLSIAPHPHISSGLRVLLSSVDPCKALREEAVHVSVLVFGVIPKSPPRAPETRCPSPLGHRKVAQPFTPRPWPGPSGPSSSLEAPGRSEGGRSFSCGNGGGQQPGQEVHGGASALEPSQVEAEALHRGESVGRGDDGSEEESTWSRC